MNQIDPFDPMVQHATSGGPERPGRQLGGPALSFELASEVRSLQGESSWERGDRNAKTLVKERFLQVVLVAMKAGARLPEHQTDGHASIQTLSGHLRFHLSDGVIDLAAGGLLVLEPGVPHTVEALEQSAFLLTLGELGSAEVS